MAKGKSRKGKKKQTGIRDAFSVVGDKTVASSGVRPERLRFAAAFVISCIVLYAAVQALPPSFTRPLNEHTALSLGLVLRVLGIPSISIVNDVVSDGRMSVKIVPECTPIFTAGLFVCFIVFNSASVRKKAAGLLAGIPVLYLGNIARLAVVFMIGRHDQRLFEVVHVYLGQVFTLLMVSLSCILWLKWIDEDEPKRGIPLKVFSFLVRFVLISGCVFFVWMEAHHGYIRLLDRFMLFGFSLFGHHFNPAQRTPVYYETFSIVTFTSLVLAIRSTPWKTRIQQLAAGLGFLFFSHLFHRIDNFLMVLFNYSAAVTADFTLLLAGQYLLPVLLLIYSIRRQRQETLPGTGKPG